MPSNFLGLFPETSTRVLTYNHFLFLGNFLSYKILTQQKLLEKTNLDKTNLDQIKVDFIRLGLYKDINFCFGKEIAVRICRLFMNEIKFFLGHLKFLKHAIPVRPNKINAKYFLQIRPCFESFKKGVKNE